MQLSDYDIECLHNAKSIIDADLSRHLTIATIAEKSGMGSTKLKQSFKYYFGLPLFKYLREERMKKAKQLLEETKVTIKNIAKQTGYKHYRNFIKAYTSCHGSTPGKIRKQQANKNPFAD